MNNQPKKPTAQGTIEYLIIIAIVVIIGLAVVSLLINSMDSENISISSTKTKQLIGKEGLSIIDNESNSKSKIN